MALDGAFLYAIKQELRSLVGGRVEKILQPSQKEIVISIRIRQEQKKIYISVNAISARINITQSQLNHSKISPSPMFCILLRKHLGNGKLISIRQNGLERILFLDFECVNELRDVIIVTLACEIMGRCSNLIIINEKGIVIDSIKHINEAVSRKRIVLPGIKYTMPPRYDRLNFLSASMDDIYDRIYKIKSADLSKVLIYIFEGISPVLANEWASFVERGSHILSNNISEDQLNRLYFIINRTRKQLITGKCCYSIIYDKNGVPKDFSFIRLNQYSNLIYTKEMSTASELLDYFYTEHDRTVRTKQRAHDLFKLLVNLTERTKRRISIQKKELLVCSEKDKFKLFGDLIYANMYSIKNGDISAEVKNFYDKNCPIVVIDLDIRKTPSQNAQHYYTKYKKCVIAEEKLAQQIKDGFEELHYLDSVFDALTRAESENDIMQIRIELNEQGYVKSVYSSSKSKLPKAFSPIEYKSSDGFKIYVGKNNYQNDNLTLKIAKKSDIWLHTQIITGSHVIIVTEGITPPNRTIEEAAIIAAVNSKGRNENLVPVNYCLAKYVKKPSNSKPGKVIFTNYKTAFVRPDIKLESNLRI